MFLLCIIEENAPAGGVLARFYRPGGGGFELFLAGGGEFAHQKIARVLPGRWSDLELTDTQKKQTTNMRTICGMINFAMSP